MKVLHLIGGGDDGGAKIHVLSLVKELSKYIEVKIVSFRHGIFSDDALVMGIDIEVVKESNVFLDIKRVVDIIKTEKIDIIHSHGAKANMMSVICSVFVKVPRITTVHSDYRLDYMQSMGKKLTFGTINTIALRCLKNYIAVSNNFKTMLIERNFNKNNIFTLYNGVDFSAPRREYCRSAFLEKYNLPFQEQDIIIGILARLHPVKGFGTFLSAAKEVIAARKSVKFLIGGEGEERKNLEREIQSRGLSNSVFLLGYVSDPYEFMSNIDMNILTSISESFPYSILEGTMYKKATISSDVGGISDLIEHNINGYLITPGDYKSLASYILKLIEDTSLRAEFGEKIYEKAMHMFSLENMCETQLSIYETLLKQKQSLGFLNHKTPLKETLDSNSSKNDYDVIISGYYGFKNIGDEAMLKSIIESIQKHRNNIKIVVLSNNPQEAINTYKIGAVNRFNLLGILYTMKKAKLFINGGGSLIQDNSSTRSLFYYLFMIWLAKKMRMKVMIYANGIGPLNKKSNKRLATYVLNQVDIITVREKMSYTEIKNLGVLKPTAIVTADPALLINPIEEAEIDTLLHQEGLIGDNLVGFSIRQWNKFHDYENIIANVADYMVEKYKIIPVFLPMHNPDDVFIIEDIISRMKNKGFLTKNRYNASQILGLISRFKLLIGMRLHALIFAASVGVPIIGLSYEPKVEGFMKYINQGNLCISGNLYFENMKNMVDFTWENRISIRKELELKTEFLKQKADLNNKIAMELLNSVCDWKGVYSNE